MTKDSTPRFCWDSGVMIAWLMEDTNHPLSDIEIVVRHVTEKKAIIVVPAILAFEVSRMKHTPDKYRKFEAFLRRSNVFVVDITLPIALKASEVRDEAMKIDKELKRADALVMATAVVHRVDELQTVDSRHLLRLHGTPAAFGVPVVKPRGAHGELVMATAIADFRASHPIGTRRAIVPER